MLKINKDFKPVTEPKWGFNTQNKALYVSAPSFEPSYRIEQNRRGYKVIERSHGHITDEKFFDVFEEAKEYVDLMELF